MQKTSYTSRLAKNSALIVFLSLFLLSLMGSQVIAAETVLRVMFPNGRDRYTAALGTTTLVDIEVLSVSYLYGFEFRIHYNNTVLTALNMTPYIGTTDMNGFFFPQYMIWKYTIDNDPWGNGTGFAWLCVTRPLSTQVGLSGSGVLATIEFNATEFGTTELTYALDILGDPHSVPIAHTVRTGILTVGEVTKIPEAEANGPYLGAVDTPLTLNATGSFDPQGLPLVSLFWDFGDGTNATTTHLFIDHTYTAVGNYTALLIVTDADGLTNSDTADVQIVVDSTPPTGSVTITGRSPDPTHFTNTTSVTLRFSYYDAASGVYQMRVSNDNATLPSLAWTQVVLSRAWTLTTGDGIKTVFVQYLDRAGWPSLVYSRSIILDTTSPAVTITSPSEGSEVRSASVPVTWDGSDGGSGISYYEVRLDGGSWTTVGTDVTETFDGLSEWGHTVEIRAFDKAGNSVVISGRFTVNLSPFGGPGYLEEAVVIAVVIVVVAGVAVYFFKFRKKS